MERMRIRMKKKSKIKNLFINLLIVLLILLGLALIFNNKIKNFIIEKQSDKYTISHVSRENIVENANKEASFDFEAVESVSAEKVLQAQMKQTELPVIAGVAIPSVAINLPIFKGLGNEGLWYGAGTFRPDQVMGEGNYALASHRLEESDLLFSHLDQVAIGDVVYLTDLEHVYTYQVTVSTRIDPTQVEVVEDVPEKKMVTLITCGEASAVTRWMVQGELAQVTAMDQATETMLAAFQMAQKTY